VRRQAINRRLKISIKCQCSLLKVNRSSFYYQPVGISELELTLMKLIDQKYLETPFYGSRKMTEELKREGYPVNRKRIRRLMQIMGLQAIYRRPRTSLAGRGHKIYPYLLKGLKTERPNQVWAADITYIPMEKGFLYLVAIIDLYSRYVLSWRLSNSLETGFCVEALKEALQKGTPEIFNTDQGCQFTADEFVTILTGRGIRVSMDSVGRYLDNIFVERFWRTLKYEEVYLKAYQDGLAARSEIGKYIRFYNTKRPHQALGYKTPAEEYCAQTIAAVKEPMLQSNKPDISTTYISMTAGSHLNLE
jgi:putative transposase